MKLFYRKYQTITHNTHCFSFKGKSQKIIVLVYTLCYFVLCLEQTKWNKKKKNRKKREKWKRKINHRNKHEAIFLWIVFFFLPYFVLSRVKISFKLRVCAQIQKNKELNFLKENFLFTLPYFIFFLCWHIFFFFFSSCCYFIASRNAMHNATLF